MAYLGNLTCRDCGLTFTSRWGSYDDVDEYRCSNDHVVHASADSGAVLAVDGVAVDDEAPPGTGAGPPTLVDLRGRCPRCSTELATGLLPSCPVCGGRDHDVLVAGTLA
ncbi:MAG: hydrogenase maturation nickel metallochaperone HypA [Actinomycetota bacterium]|nr:hydrogenase maturation nickel metallochaperone HypA [Actinomycetota bacterium]